MTFPGFRSVSLAGLDGQGLRSDEALKVNNSVTAIFLTNNIIGDCGCEAWHLQGF